MRHFVFIFTAILLTACNLASPATENAPVVETDIPATQVVTPDPQLAGTPIVYWRFASILDVTPTDEDIVIFGLGILRRVETTTARTGIPSSDLQTSIQGMMNSQNVWTVENVVIESVIVEGDMVTVRLSGTISAVGGAILSIVPTQFQLTVFEEPGINRALITLNGQNIANIGISHSSQAVADNVPFTREGLTATLLTLE